MRTTEDMCGARPDAQRMRFAPSSILALFLIAIISNDVVAQSCQSTPDRHGVAIGMDQPGGLKLAYGQAFHHPLGPGWIFTLVPQPHGWVIRIHDREPVTDAVDLTAMTPPQRGPENPRDLMGWHFRNAANTGPNQGDVNAPGIQRALFISPGLAGTGGYKPSSNPDTPALTAPDPNVDGLGWLRILDYGLADLEPGQRARMVYLAFEACLTWPKTADERRREADAASAVYVPEEIEMFHRCGLESDRYELDAAILPRILEGDIDGDGSIDLVAQTRRKSDGRRALAICLAGSRLLVVGLDNANIVGEALRPGYIDQMEAWRMLPPDHGDFGYINAPAWPNPAGDSLALERIEKELILVFWRDDTPRVQQVYRYIEP